MKNSKVKTIDISAKEWFDKVNGNSYFDCKVVVNFQREGERVFMCPFQYGYGSSYETAALKCLQNEYPGFPPSLYDIRKSGIILRTRKQENCLKRELLNPAKKMMDKASKDGWSYYPYFEPSKVETS